MTKFVRSQFDYQGGYLTYRMNPSDGVYRGVFIARFKRQRKDKASFLSFLIKNFSVEEYFALRDAGKAPAEILETKGYVSLTVRQILAKHGYPGTIAGRDAYIKAQVAQAQGRAAA